MVNKDNLFVPEVAAAHHDPKQTHPKTIRHRGFGEFAVNGQTIKLKSKMP